MVECNTFVWQWRFYGIGGPSAPDPYVQGFTLGKINEAGLIDYQYVEFNSLVCQSLESLQEYLADISTGLGDKCWLHSRTTNRWSFGITRRRLSNRMCKHLVWYVVVIANSRILLQVLFVDSFSTFLAILRYRLLCFVCRVVSVLREVVG